MSDPAQATDDLFIKATHYHTLLTHKRHSDIRQQFPLASHMIMFSALAAENRAMTFDEGIVNSPASLLVVASGYVMP